MEPGTGLLIFQIGCLPASALQLCRPAVTSNQSLCTSFTTHSHHRPACPIVAVCMQPLPRGQHTNTTPPCVLSAKLTYCCNLGCWAWAGLTDWAGCMSEVGEGAHALKQTAVTLGQVFHERVTQPNNLPSGSFLLAISKMISITNNHHACIHQTFAKSCKKQIRRRFDAPPPIPQHPQPPVIAYKTPPHLQLHVPRQAGVLWLFS
ncbi:uncharacterized protein BDR25DRAFT_359534 [Lindgomyces ingoldianus]|uniref:Uncharacterized protein n=1 Tax=Lindgomyces ingoldianus TaxID=673940 RepID=A0ACB6QIB6_9PLEO|nr:uncharacterized protein BDR25DRAFT_359534 [Lindgomyces ingoldianus]KAF2466635.1 hypothetical protein BDR25DRAFT_359534 [Lindgomyces ingoldianus]